MSNDCGFVDGKVVEEFNIEDLPAGIAMERTVIMESANPIYNGKMLRIRSLRGREFRQITSKVPIKMGDVASNFLLCMEACRLAILTPGVAEKIADFDHDVILQVGGVILTGSQPEEEKVEDFSKAE
jgi:hypothetical protein